MINFIMSICDHSGNRVVFVMRIFQGHVGIVRFVRGPGAGGRKRKYKLVMIWHRSGLRDSITANSGNDAERYLSKQKTVYANDALRKAYTDLVTKCTTKYG
jgi:hypothetical protein